MGVWIAAAAVAAGAAISAGGASKNAAAVKAAQQQIGEDENEFADKWSARLNRTLDKKSKKLHNLGNIFDRFKSTGAFGDTNTHDNLRQAQEDFSLLAAGDFTGFEAQLRKVMSDTLINTVGSGSPVGTFAGLAADQQMNMRLQGVQTASGLSEFFAGQANNLLGLEFGIMDQRFDKGYNIDRNRLTAVNNSLLGQANTEGIAMQSWGGALQTAGGAFMGASTGMTGQKNIETEQAQRQQVINAQYAQMGTPQYTPQNNYSYSAKSPIASYSAPSNSYYGSSGPIQELPMAQTYFPDQFSAPQSYGSTSDRFMQQYGGNQYSSMSILSSVGAQTASNGVLPPKSW